MSSRNASDGKGRLDKGERQGEEKCQYKNRIYTPGPSTEFYMT